MSLLILVSAVILCGVPVFTAVYLFQKPHGVLAYVYMMLMIVALAASYFTTFRYEYYANSNTRIHGWPVPAVIFQREGPDAPWLDYIGWNAIAAFPANAALYAFIPSLFFFAICRRHRKRHNNETQKLPG